MSIPSLADILGGTVSEGYDDAPLPIGDYNAVIAGCEVRQGQQRPYLRVDATVFDGAFKWAKVYGVLSFSREAVSMPGGVTPLRNTRLQSPPLSSRPPSPSRRTDREPSTTSRQRTKSSSTASPRTLGPRRPGRGLRTPLAPRR